MIWKFIFGVPHWQLWKLLILAIQQAPYRELSEIMSSTSADLHFTSLRPFKGIQLHAVPTSSLLCRPQWDPGRFPESFMEHTRCLVVFSFWTWLLTLGSFPSNEWDFCTRKDEASLHQNLHKHKACWNHKYRLLQARRIRKQKIWNGLYCFTSSRNKMFPSLLGTVMQMYFVLELITGSWTLRATYKLQSGENTMPVVFRRVLP